MFNELASIVALIFTMCGFSQASAQTPPAPTPIPAQSEFKLNITDVFEGSTVGSRYLYLQDNSGTIVKDQAQGRVDLKVKIETHDGKFRLRARILTGPRYEASWDNLGAGNGTKFDASPKLRQLYLDYSPNQSVSLEAGAIPSTPTNISTTPLVLDGDGWVDGVRVYFKNLDKIAAAVSSVVVTIGQVDEYTHPGLFDRQMGRPNFVQIDIQGRLNDRIKYLVEGTHLKDDDYLRSAVELNTKDMLSFLDAVVVDDMFRTGDSKNVGYSLALKKTLNSFRVTGTYSYKDKDISQVTENSLQLTDNYRQGRMVTLLLEKDFKRGVTPFVQVGKTLEVSGARGLRFETGIKVTLKKKKS